VDVLPIAPARGCCLSFRYHNPVDVLFGAGMLDRLPEVVGDRKAVVVTFPEAEALGVAGRLRRHLGKCLIGVIADVEPNPDVAHLARLYARFRDEHSACEVIVAVGGGSALDTAKVLMVAPPNGGFAELVRLLARGEAFVPRDAIPLIAIPTTAGTGSEVTPWATVWDRAVNRKYSLHLRETWPQTAIVDPELTLSLPRAVTIQSGLDALSHALESIWNVNANPVSDTHAVAAASRMMRTLPQLADDPGNIGLRSATSLAALQAGLAFSNTKTALAHSISYEMTLRYGLPHGIACSFTLPMVLERAIGHSAERDRVLAAVFPCPLGDAPEYLRSFLEGLDVSTRFESYGVPETESRKMISDALEGPRGRNFIGTPAH
jgi:phosphonate metabolism-associated iron-containing alcohol dehydrogenase